jgi:hypothetical protein
MDESIHRLIKNYSTARTSWETWCFLNDLDMKKSSKVIRELCGNNKLFYHFRYLSLKDVHIELYKILKENSSSKDNIFKLLKNDYRGHSELFEEFKKLDYEIKAINNARDKIYAHLDPDFNEYMESFKVNDFYRAFDLIEKSIIALGYETQLLEALKLIPSRDEFELRTN